jgi:hypothetical protein
MSRIKAFDHVEIIIEDIDSGTDRSAAWADLRAA